MDGVGPNGEAIIDYSIYDAIRAGFGKVVFVIRHSFADAFTEVFNAERFGGRIEVGVRLSGTRLSARGILGSGGAREAVGY